MKRCTVTFKHFEGLTALDLTQGMAGGITTMLLADYGAQVLKIEPPSGDPTRESPAFYLWNRGKKSLVLDLKSTEGRLQAHQLAEQADVLVESFRPGVASRLGLGYEDVRQLNPALVYCSITGFRREGPYSHLKGYEGIVAAKAGRMANLSGAVQRKGPVYAAVNALSYTASQIALQGIFAALYVREKSGRGQWVETNLLQGATINGGGGGGGFTYLHQYLNARTKDGHWIQLANISSHLFRAFMQCLSLEHLYQNPAFKDVLTAVEGFGTGIAITEALLEDANALRDIILITMMEKTLSEWMKIFIQDGNVGGEPVLTAQEAMEHPQMRYNAHIVEMDDARLGKIKQIGPLVAFANGASFEAQPAPRLDEHRRDSVARENGTGPSASIAFPPSSGDTPLPRSALEGVIVVDLADWLAGGLGPTLVADLGARVIKVERISGDPLRGPVATAMLGVTVQGKESLAVDLKTSEGQEIVHKLAAKADLFVHNYRPGVPEKLGIDYETLAAINPDLVYLYASAYGESGPYASRPAYNPIPDAVCGAHRVQAGTATPPTPETSLSIEEMREVSRRLGRADRAGGGDPNSGLGVATALLLGLYVRERTGQTDKMLTTMLCSNAFANSDDFISYEGKPSRPIPGRGGARPLRTLPFVSRSLGMGVPRVCQSERVGETLPGLGTA